MGANQQPPFQPPGSPRIEFGEAPTVMSKPTLSFSMQVDARGEWRWSLRNTGTGRPLAESGEGYKSRQDCRKAIEQVRRCAADAEVVDQG